MDFQHRRRALRAVEFRIGGSMQFLFEQYGNTATNPYYAFQDSKAFHDNVSNVPGGEKYFYHNKHNRVLQRLILNAVITASPDLYAMVDFILGFHTWGGPATGVGPFEMSNGGALGTRAANLVTRMAFLSWTIPHTNIKIRMGQQFFLMPGFAVKTLPIKQEFGTGMVVSAPLSDKVNATFIWQRANSGPRRGTHPAYPSSERQHDNFDVLALTTPVKLDGFRFAPYVALSIEGQHSNMAELDYSVTRWGYHFGINNTVRTRGYAFGDHNLMPLWGAAAQANVERGTRWQPGTSTGWYLGLGGEMTRYDPFRIGFDFAWTKATASHEMFNRGGWYLALAASYKTRYGVPTIKSWFTSGDDSDIQNGSERPLAWNSGYPDTGFLTSSDSGFLSNGHDSGSIAGTWGVSLQWNKIKFLDSLSHDLRVYYIRGTNSRSMVRYAKLGWDNHMPPSPGFVINYMSTGDSLVEIDLENTWQIQKNLRLFVEGAYIINHFDTKAWGYWSDDHTRLITPARFSNPWRVSMVLAYEF